MLEGVLTQTHRIDELIIGDDGSQPDTRELIDTFAQRAPFPVVFTTQEDAGFRKAKALNNALRKASGRVVLFLDGDCIPPPEWAGRHLAAIDKGVDFTTGGYVYLSLQRTTALSCEQIGRGLVDAVAEPDELRKLRKIHRREILYRLLGKRKKPRILGGNWAATRASLIEVNGFDENFDQFTKEDSDIRNRLRNSGFKGLSLWDKNWVMHCCHDLDPRRNLPEVVRGMPDQDYYLSRKHATVAESGLQAME